MLKSFNDCRTFIKVMMASTDPSVLTLNEFAFSVDNINKCKSKKLDTGSEIPDIMDIKALIILACMCGYTNIINNPYDIPIYVTSSIFNNIFVLLQDVNVDITPENVFQILGINKVKFPIKIEQHF